MKHQNIIPRVAMLSHAFTAAVLLSCAAVLTLPSPALAGKGNQGNPGVSPPQSHANGMTYGNWGAAWWTWAVGIPAEINPLLDTTGEFCDVNQEGPVWFLAGTFGGDATRTCTVPKGKALLVPILNQMLNAPEDLPYSEFIATHLGLDPSTLSDGELMRVAVNFNMDHATFLAVNVDGVELANLAQYRDDSDIFPVVLSDIWEPDYPAGPREVNVTDGYYVMLRPLTPGEHTIHIQSEQQFIELNGDPFDFEWSMDVTYHLTVK